MFEQDVAGLIKSLRSNKNEELKVIQKTLLEIKKEIKSKDFEIKSNSILKLVYLEMLGYSISFSNFTIIECMSSTKFNIKFIGYLAASQCFDKETEVAVLIVNLVKKDLLSPPTSSIFTTSPTSLTTSHLITILSSISLLLSSPTLSRDLAPTILSLLNHSKPIIRKQTLLVLFKLVKSYPNVKELSDGLSSSTLDELNDEEDSTIQTTTKTIKDPWIERLRERLSDEDLGVVSATVNLICELVRKDNKEEEDISNYLSLAPELFSLLTGSTNNWMLIKIIKLFAVLTPIEPRLIKKLVPPLTELIETTTAMSLLFECIQTSIVGGILSSSREGEILAHTCVNKLKGFLVDSDQNLRYIALVALSKILPTHPHLVSKHSKIILNCIDDEDMSIRSRALDLVEGVVDRGSLEMVVERLIGHLIPPVSTTTSGKGSTTAAESLQQASSAKPSASATTPILLTTNYKISLISLILRMCSTNSTYSNVSNFNWYIDILVQLSYITASLSLSLPSSTIHSASPLSLGKQLKNDLIDVTARVRAIRNYSVEKMSELLGDDEFLVGGRAAGGLEIEEVLGAAAWICGEYCRELENPPPTIASLFSPSPLLNSSPKILAQYYHNGLKLYSYWLSTLASTSTWDESIHKDSVREVTIALMGKLDSVGSSNGVGGIGDDVELLERCSEAKGLLDLVKKGLDGPRIDRRESSPSLSSNGFNNQEESENDEEDKGGFNAPLEPPLALLLLTKLFTSHELNPVNPKAQSMVQIPDGLDLNLVINPISMRRPPIVQEEKREVDDYGRYIGRAREEVERDGSGDRKGKGKERSGGIIRKSRRKEIVEDPVEIARLKAERLERQRDDPYYVGSSAPLASNQNQQDVDIDSIPIVQLSLDDLNGVPSTSTSTSRPSPIRRTKTPPLPVFVDLEGEMPDSIPSSSRSTPIPQFTQQEEEKVEELDVEKEKLAERRAEEGLAVKVVKKKSKKDSSGNTISGEKKKRKEKKVVVLEE